MLSTARSRAIWQFSRRASVAGRRAYASPTNNQQEINDPNKPKEVPNVSKSNELPTATLNKEVHAMQENVEIAEKLRVTQAPNRLGVWSRSQSPRSKAMTGPRFEQTIMDLQVSYSGYCLRLAVRFSSLTIS
jgi:NADH dehydrogenase (ubiquinone) Fe-S protein 6